MTDDLKQKMDGIYGWSVDGDKIQPPTHRFPKAVKDRADYFSEMMEDGLTFLGCLEFIFSDEKPKHYDFGATKDWLPKSKEFEEWEHGIGTTMTFSHQEMVIYLLFPMWEEAENDTENPDLVEELT
ncbi:hypothetical protein [Streptococcus suis]|uniref:hypothetical protein n=1 Tax=Streptococcus suis TaxID=1307 RepID=UPI0004044FE6|nr:hypothetical protein [Streptococcus suis]HEM3180829.1 hypothetical protein [Streptococcus suis 92-4172]